MSRKLELVKKEVDEALERFDANGDGVVDAGEFLEAMRLHEEQMKPTPTKKVIPQQPIVQGASPIRQPRMKNNLNADGSRASPSKRQNRITADARVSGWGGGDLLSPVAAGSAGRNRNNSGRQTEKPKWRR